MVAVLPAAVFAEDLAAVFVAPGLAEAFADFAAVDLADDLTGVAAALAAATLDPGLAEDLAEAAPDLEVLDLEAADLAGAFAAAVFAADLAAAVAPVLVAAVVDLVAADLVAAALAAPALPADFAAGVFAAVALPAAFPFDLPALRAAASAARSSGGRALTDFDTLGALVMLPLGINGMEPSS